MKSTTSSVKSCMSSSWPVLTPGSTNLSSFRPVFLSYWGRSPWCWAPMRTSWPPSWGSSPLRAAGRPSPPAPPTSAWLGSSLECHRHVHGPQVHHPEEQRRSFPCFTVSSTPCWTHSSTAWGAKRSRVPLGECCSRRVISCWSDIWITAPTWRVYLELWYWVSTKAYHSVSPRLSHPRHSVKNSLFLPIN